MATAAATPRLGPVFETERLILRPPMEEDFAGYCEFHGDKETMRFLGGVQSPSLVWRAMRSVAGSWALDGFSLFSILEKSTGKWVGRIGPIRPHQWPGPEVAWGLHPAYCGKGYAKEAAVVAIDFAFDSLGWDHVIHAINPENTRSSALAKALGSYNQGSGALPEPYAELRIDIWGQSRDEWRSKNRRQVI